MEIDESKLSAIIDRVVARLQANGTVIEPAPSKPKAAVAPLSRRHKGIFGDVDQAVLAAEQAHQRLMASSLDLRARIIERLRGVLRGKVEELSRLAVEETGMGRAEDKIIKNLLVINRTPGVEILRPVASSGDHGLVLTERAPYGVIGAITPCTNPTETIICNGIGMVAGGNAVVFNTHPSAKGVSAHLIDMMNHIIMDAGGPENLLTAVAEPTIETGQAMMKHEGVALLVVTGGPAVVKVAMNSGKKVIAAGPGNPPVVVDDTAPLDRAARDIVTGASCDNNIICIVEKEIIVVDSAADSLKKELSRQPTMELSAAQRDKLAKVLVPDGAVNKKFVGKNANVLLREIGVQAPDSLRLLYCEADESHPFVQEELLMPLVGLVRVRDVDEAIEMAVRVEHGYRHTAVMHSTNIESLSRMARRINTSIFVKNGPSLAGLGEGGEGYTSFTIASPTGEGLTTAVHFTRERRCTLKDSFRIV